MIKPSEGTGSCSITMRAGTKIKVSVPFNKIQGQSWFASQDTQKYFNGTNRSDVIRGFLVENSNIGTITDKDDVLVDGELAVVYTHLKDAENRIWFFADTGETAVCNVSRIPIHDHATISQGGPAYATYFSGNIEDTSQGEQEQ